MADSTDTDALRVIADLAERDMPGAPPLLRRAADELDRRREQEQRVRDLGRLWRRAAHVNPRVDDTRLMLSAANDMRAALDGTPAPDTHQEKP